MSRADGACRPRRPGTCRRSARACRAAAGARYSVRRSVDSSAQCRSSSTSSSGCVSAPRATNSWKLFHRYRLASSGGSSTGGAMSGKRRRGAGAMRGDLRGDVAECLAQRERTPRAGDRLLDHLHIGQVRRRAVQFDAVAGQHPHAARLGFTADLVDQPGLPHAGLAADEGEPAVAGERLVHRSPQVRSFAVPVHEWRQGRCHASRALYRCGLTPGHPEQPPSLVESLEPEQT